MIASCWLRKDFYFWTGCSDAQKIRIVADSDQRTRETGKALAEASRRAALSRSPALPERNC